MGTSVDARVDLPLSASDAIAFALGEIADYYEMRDFLDSWQHGEWDFMRAEWPEAFEEKK